MNFIYSSFLPTSKTKQCIQVSFVFSLWFLWSWDLDDRDELQWPSESQYSMSTSLKSHHFQGSNRHCCVFCCTMWQMTADLIVKETKKWECICDWTGSGIAVTITQPNFSSSMFVHAQIWSIGTPFEAFSTSCNIFRSILLQHENCTIRPWNHEINVSKVDRQELLKWTTSVLTLCGVWF